MRICSLVPGATEVVAALGLADRLVGISHECDFPAAVRHAPIMVEAAMSSDMTDSAEIDHRVKALMDSGRPLYRLNEQAFANARPDLILTQDLCDVCAVTPSQLGRAIHSLTVPPYLMTLHPSSLGDVISDVERIGKALGRASKGRELAQSLHRRIAAVRTRSASLRTRPRVICLEWLSPLYIGGHWIPEMVTLAGGQDMLGRMNQPSRQVTWDEVRAADPAIVLVMPCGFSVARTVTELESLCRTAGDWSHALASWPKVYVVDAGSYFSRPGPRLVDGVELLADIFSGTISSGYDSAILREISGTSFLIGPSS